MAFSHLRSRRGPQGRKNMSDKLAWIDTETTGIDPQVFRIIEVAVQVTDADLNVLEEYETKIALSPKDRMIAEPKALEVNGYTDEEWADAPPASKEIWEKVRSLTSKCYLAGQNIIEFDCPFVAAEMLRFGLRPGWFRRRLDTMSLSVMVMFAKQVKNDKGALSASLPDVYDALGGPELPPHRAMADIKRAQYVYRYFQKGLQANEKPGVRVGEGVHFIPSAG